jgi:hypothetical protein
VARVEGLEKLAISYLDVNLTVSISLWFVTFLQLQFTNLQNVDEWLPLDEMTNLRTISISKKVDRSAPELSLLCSILFLFHGEKDAMPADMVDCNKSKLMELKSSW